MKCVQIKARFRHKIHESNSFMICQYGTETPITLPDGKKHTTFRVKGYLLPEVKDIDVILSGCWTQYKKSGTNQKIWTLQVVDFEEVKPDAKVGIIAYLQTLQGVGKKTAESMYDAFGNSVFTVIETTPEKLARIRGVSKKKIELITVSYGKRKYAKELFQYLYPFHIKDTRIIKVHKMWGKNALQIIKENPYRLTEISGIGFDTAERIAKHEHLPADFLPRIEAGIIEVLSQGEHGGDLFSEYYHYPEFTHNMFFSEQMVKQMLAVEDCNITGGTYLPRDIVYLMTIKLLKIRLSEAMFDQIAISLHNQNRIYICVDRNDGSKKINFYRCKTAKAEIASAEKLSMLMKAKIEKIEDLDLKIKNAQNKLQMRLSDEQASAVKMALSNPVSVITGGPGTGKTSIQKGILSVFKAAFPKAGILLAAPTGRAAKRMNESTGEPTATLHKALNLYAGENGETVESGDDFTFTEKLIIIDECSMLGSLLFNTLLSHIREGTRVVFVGDVDQLPSIEVGAVLKELIESGSVPVTKLTKTFRQASGSNIAVNAARIKHGQNIMSYGDDFRLIEASTSEEIANIAVSLYPSLVDEYGIDNVVCLSAYRKSTASGTNNLNNVLRTAIRNDITENTPFYERKGVRYYVGDRVMYTRNTEELTNGDLGEILDIKKGKDMLQVTCIFEGKRVLIEDDDVNDIELALAMTVHKSQGSEYPVVLMICDMAHSILLKRNLIYTGLTRARQKIFIIGQKEEAFDKGIQIIDSNFRRSRLGYLLNNNTPSKKVDRKKKEHETQLKINM